MPNLQVEPYFTPQGWQDYPFAYVYDASSLTDGTTYNSIQKALQGNCQFILRHIAGVPLCVDTGANGGRFNFKNASGSYAIANPGQPAGSNLSGLVMPNNWPVVPEKLYPFNASIYFDLIKALRASSACGGVTVYSSYLAFFGVKRFQEGQGYPIRVTPYKYREKRYSYEYSLTINWGHYTNDVATILNQPHRFIIPTDNYDFELFQIGISESTGSGGLTRDDFQMMLYDPDMHQLSDLPLNQSFINAARSSPSAAPPYQGIMPAPSIVYPAGGNIVFDITSLLCNSALPITYNLSFQGVWRIPC